MAVACELVKGRQAHCITGHEYAPGPCRWKLITGPGSSLGFQSGGWNIGNLAASWPSCCMFQPSFARSPTSSAVRLAADSWSRQRRVVRAKCRRCVIHC